MANHEKFQALSLPERWIANGKMQHAYANSPKFFEKLNKLIEQAEKDGVYADVKFLPEKGQERPNIDSMSCRNDNP